MCCYLLAGVPAFNLACQANRLVLMKSVVSKPPSNSPPAHQTNNHHSIVSERSIILNESLHI